VGLPSLETVGRKSGKTRRTPVGNGRVGSQFWIVAEHGRKAGYVRNIEANPRVRLKLREGFRSRGHTGTAHILLMMIRVRGRIGWLDRCAARAAMRRRCGFSGRSCLL